MRSFAIWYDKKGKKKKKFSKADPEIDIHINFWEQNICGGKREKVFIDFGFMIKCSEEKKKVAKLHLYCPFVVQKENVKDLGNVIHAHDELVNAIFNENYNLSKGIARYLRVYTTEEQKAKGKDDFIIYQLKEENFEFKQVSDDCGSKGTTLSLLLSNVFPEKNHDSYNELKNFKQFYFRFRVSTDAQRLKFVSREPKNISPFQEAFTETQIVDFRLNSLRSCNSEIKDLFAKGNHFDIKAVHYLILRKASDVFSYHGSMKLSSRLMESELWSHYIKNLQENVIAYHFKPADGNCNEVVVLTRFEYQKWNSLLVELYIAVIILFGTLSGFLASWLSDKFP